jgi:TolB-like protein/Tfp pilus assembly protein PilF
MADDLITRLSNLRQVTVRPTSAVLKYAGDESGAPNPVAAGKALGVESVLKGSIRRAGERIRVTVQLVSVRDGTPLWAEKFDEKFTDILSVQEAVAEQVSQALVLQLTGDERRLLTKRYTNNPEAYQLYLKGRFFWEKRSEKDLKKAIVYFQQAVDLDPDYALAYAGIAHCYAPLSSLGYVPAKEGRPRQKAAAMKALELDDTLAEAHTVLAAYLFSYEWDWVRSEQEFKRAMDLNPNYPTTYLWYGVFLEKLGRQEENLAARRRAQELDPLNMVINQSVGRALFLNGRTDQAIEQLLKTLELHPSYPPAHSDLGEIYLQQGRYEEAIAQFQQAEDKGSLGHAYAVSGNRSEAQKLLAELKERSPQRYNAPFEIALIYTGLGDKDRAFAWLEKAYAERITPLITIKIDQRFNSLRSDARFADLLRRVGLAP